MTTQDMKVIHNGQTEGKVIQVVYDTDHGWKAHPCKTRVPGSRYLMNYDLVFGDKTLLVLDAYGNDFISEDIGERLVGQDRGPRDFLLGIDRATGEIYLVTFFMEKRKLVAVVGQSFESKPKVPKKYLKLLDNLKSCKRPWMLTWNHQSWLSFHERESGWPDFMAEAVISLEVFRTKGRRSHGRYLEVWGERHRVVTAWM